MKRKFFVLGISLLILAGFSCKKLIAALFGGIEFNAPNITVTIPAIPYVSNSELQLATITQSINLDSIVKAGTANQFGADVVKSVTIKSITINVTNADDLNNLSNFQSARVTLTSNNNSTPATLASITFPTANSNTYVYTPTSSPDLVSYLKGNSLTYTLYGQNRKITTKSLNFVMSVRLAVN